MKYIFKKLEYQHGTFWDKTVGKIRFEITKRNVYNLFYSEANPILGKTLHNSHSSLEEALNFLEPFIDAELKRMEDEIASIRSEVV